VRVARSITLDQVRIEEVDDPVPSEGEVVCDVLACGVCASDVTDWYVQAKLPAVLGHEPAGVVTAVGDGVRNVAVGDRVAIHHHSPCGECRRCRRGHETLCERFRATRLEPGGFAERLRVPGDLVDELLPLPDGLDPVCATLIEPLACVIRAQDRASLRAGDSLLVVGAGVNGLLQIAAARARGVEVVWVREPRPDRLALAIARGAERHGNELVDVAIACTPRPDAIAAAAEALAPGGTLCMYAPPAPGSPLPLDGTSLFMRELSVTASYSAGPGDMRAALELLSRGAVDLESLVTHRLPLEETARALSLQRRGEALKAVVVPHANGAALKP
jgi:L-iditol 2-dehydrogenase